MGIEDGVDRKKGDDRKAFTTFERPSAASLGVRDAMIALTTATPSSVRPAGEVVPWSVRKTFLAFIPANTI